MLYNVVKEMTQSATPDSDVLGIDSYCSLSLQPKLHYMETAVCFLHLSPQEQFQHAKEQSPKPAYLVVGRIKFYH
jgi:hypothetical protein